MDVIVEAGAEAGAEGGAGGGRGGRSDDFIPFRETPMVSRFGPISRVQQRAVMRHPGNPIQVLIRKYPVQSLSKNYIESQKIGLCHFSQVSSPSIPGVSQLHV